MLLYPGPWLGKVLYDMKNKSALNGDPMFEDLKLLLYSAVSLLIFPNTPSTYATQHTSY